MMLSSHDPLEMIWDGLLSQDPEQVRQIFFLLDQASQQSVLQHLCRMVEEPDWLPIQQQSAKFALDILLPIINKSVDKRD